MKKKALVVGIIFLFIGIAIAPSVTSIEFSKTQTSNNNDLVEITLQLCKNDGVENQTLFITKELDEQLDKLFSSFKSDLDNVKTMEESNNLYFDMIVSLNELGLLPEGLTVKEAQKLVVGDYNKDSRAINALDKESKKIVENGFCENSFCKIVGETNNTFIWSIITTGSMVLFDIIDYIVYEKLFDGLWNFFEKHEMWFMLDLFPYLFLIPSLIIDMIEGTLLNIMEISGLFSFINPISIWQIIDFGYADYIWGGYWIPYPAYGWIHTVGLNGTQTREGEMFGQIKNLPIVWALNHEGGIMGRIYPGVTGFNGIKFYASNSTYYIGFDKKVKVGPNPP